MLDYPARRSRNLVDQDAIEINSEERYTQSVAPLRRGYEAKGFALTAVPSLTGRCGWADDDP